MKRDCMRCSTGRFLLILMICGLGYVLLTHKSHTHSFADEATNNTTSRVDNNTTSRVDEGFTTDHSRFQRFWRKPPRLPPRLTPDEMHNSNTSNLEFDKLNSRTLWMARQESVKQAFLHAWSGYKKYALGYDELMPLSRRGIDGLGGLGATVVDALDTSMIMGLDEVVFEAGSWIEAHLPQKINEKGQVNLFETTIRVLGGLLSAYHLSGGDGKPLHKGPAASVYLENARNLADRLLNAFTSSPTAIPFSDVVLRDRTAHPAPDGLSSTSEVSTLQLEFNYLSSITGDPKYTIESMKVFEHLQTLPKVEGLVPIYIRCGHVLISYVYYSYLDT